MDFVVEHLQKITVQKNKYMFWFHFSFLFLCVLVFPASSLAVRISDQILQFNLTDTQGQTGSQTTLTYLNSSGRSRGAVVQVADK